MNDQETIDNNLALPSGLTSVGGDFFLRGYTHPLPSGLTSVGGDRGLRDYTYPVPSGLERR